MGSRAKVVTFYGVCYEQDSADAAKFHSRDDGETEGENSPAWMAANLYRESREGVQVVNFGHYDLGGYAVALAGTVEYGEAWAPLELSEKVNLEPPTHAHATLKAFCQKHGLTWDNDPRWWAVPYYG